MKVKVFVVAFLLSISVIYAQKKVRLSVDYGYSYRLAEVSDDFRSDVKDYIEELKSGSTLDLHVSYFIEQEHGIGLTYNKFSSDNSIEFVEAFNGTTFTTDNISISFVGLEYSNLYVSSSGKHNFIGSIALGGLSFKNNSTLNGRTLFLTGNTFGIGVGINYDYMITESFALGAGLGFVAGSLSEIKASNGQNSERIELDGNNKENLTRVNLTLGLRFYL